MLRFFLILALVSCTAESNEVQSSEPKAAAKLGQKVELQISSRLDTTNSEVKEILHLYEAYINSQPDSIYDNPYWNTPEKSQYKDFDFSRASMYNGLNSDQLFSIYPPFVLSVEPVNEKYQIRVLYSSQATEPRYVGSKVWCIHQLNALKEDGEWKLENLLVEKTRLWQKKKVGVVEYVFPPGHTFDETRAKKAALFCEGIISRFNPGFNTPFQFYLANGVDDMGELENFDYYFTGITTGKAREGMILSSKGDEFYPHEFIHKLLPINTNRGQVIEEGLATFLGTKEDVEEYLPMIQNLAKDYNKRESFTLENILNNQTAWNGYPVAYPGGALICEVIHASKGDEGINQLARGKTNNYDEIISLVGTILEADKEEVIQSIKQKIREFK